MYKISICVTRYVTAYTYRNDVLVRNDRTAVH